MKWLLYPLYILIIAILLIPKEKVYFTLESMLAENQIFLTGETVSDAFLYLDAEAVDVVLDNVEIGSIDRIRLTPWIVFNSLTLSSMSLSPKYRTFFPGKIDEAVVSYSILHPFSIQIRANGNFGRCKGYFDLIEKKTRIVFDATPELRNYPLLVFKLHREKEGLVYESGL